MVNQAEEQTQAQEQKHDEAYRIAASVLDPELPVLTIEDLGVLRSVEVRDEVIEVGITPTYSGCPAMETIREDIVNAFHDRGYDRVDVKTVLAPAWSTDWISEVGKSKLEEFGIAPPGPAVGGKVSLTLSRGPVEEAARSASPASPRCPRCGSTKTKELSRFGSTACKAIWTCETCLEPFDQVKPL